MGDGGPLLLPHQPQPQPPPVVPPVKLDEQQPVSPPVPWQKPLVPLVQHVVPPALLVWPDPHSPFSCSHFKA